MSTVGGAFDETILLQQRVRAEQIAFDDRIKQQYIPHVEFMKALAKVQTANFANFKVKDKTITTEVMWMNACDITTSSEVNCTMGGNKVSTNTDTFALDITRSANYTIAECDFINNEFGMQEAIAKAQLAAEKQLAEYLTQLFVARIYAAAGINTYTGAPGVVSGNTTYIPAAYWTAELLAYFNRVAIDNNFGAPIFISGGNLYNQALIAGYNSGNSNGVGANSMFGAMNLNFDLKNIDSVIGTPVTFMLNTGSVAWVSKSFYGPEIMTMSDGKKLWAQESALVPGLVIERAYQNECDSTCGLYKHHYNNTIRAGLFVNPVGCDLNNNGILTFSCGTGS